jgi:HD-like signal output (HDOD) protein
MSAHNQAHAAEVAHPEADALVDDALPVDGQEAGGDTPVEEVEEVDPVAQAREALLARLTEKLGRNADFPAVRDSIRTIQSVARSETAHMRVFTDQILQDVSVTNKLLRLINTAFYSSVGGGTITTVSRAIALMGFAPVGMLAGSVMLFDKLPKGPQAERMREEFSQSLMAAIIANEFCPVRQMEENAYISALFQQLGRMLSQLHLQEELAQIEQAVAEQQVPDADRETRGRIERDVMGLTLDELTAEIGKQWGWPEGLIQSLRPLIPEDPEKPAAEHEYLRMVVTGANALARDLLRLPGPERLAAAERFHAQWGVPLQIKLEDMEGIVERASQKWYDVAKALGLPRPGAAKPGGAVGAKPGTHPGAKQDAKPPAKPATVGKPAPVAQAVSQPKPTAPVAGAAGVAAAAAPAAKGAARPDSINTDALSRGIEAISQAAMGESSLTEVLKLVMQVMTDALHLRRAVICLRDPGSASLMGVLGLGDGAQACAARFRIVLEPPSDLFGLLCVKNADTLISDASDPVIAKRLPAWFKQHVAAPTFLILPLTVQGRTAGMLYGDRDAAGSLAVDEATLSLLKTLRNQLVIAMRLRTTAG